ncbi:hypothetical protein [Nocardiopsis trehalosi]|uniref:hypothetical protein n=1 Tax=Nocardiopsis trehalosi TaxID=109329 RepID=UPI000AA4414C|nr:hypothetical protein [Nocardiopsis trehalosi]
MPPPPPRPVPSVLARLGRSVARHHRAVLVLGVLTLVAAGVLGSAPPAAPVPAPAGSGAAGPG